MLKLADRSLSSPTQTHLNSRQSEINEVEGFSDKVKKAQTYWDSKDNVKHGGEAAFLEIKAQLLEMTVGVELCNYCEMSEALDIEHVASKGFFPEQTFVWENYVLACKNCNTGYKLDETHVLLHHPEIRAMQAKRGEKPVSSEIAFINPRIENPLDWLILDFETIFFEINPQITHTKDILKADYTRKILELNDRRGLINDRKAAFRDYRNLLRQYIEVSQATSIAEIRAITSGYPHLDPSEPLQPAIDRVLLLLKNAILKNSHPTVWREMIRQPHKLSPELQALFAQAPAHLLA